MHAIVAAGVFVFGSAAFAQSFEVASVKPGVRDGKVRPQNSITPGRVSLPMNTFRDLAVLGFGVKSYQITGPDWLDRNYYNVIAKPPEGAPAGQIPAMVQQLLTDRFGMVFHRENREIAVYALVAGKGGAKLKEAVEDAPPMRISMGPQGLRSKGKATLARLAEVLSQFTDRPVIDMTGLKDTYDIELAWESDDPRFAAKQDAIKAAAASGQIRSKEGDGELAASSLAAAVQRLGLKLDPRKLPAEVIVIDQANPAPAEN